MLHKTYGDLIVMGQIVGFLNYTFLGKIISVLFIDFGMRNLSPQLANCPLD